MSPLDVQEEFISCKLIGQAAVLFRASGSVLLVKDKTVTPCDKNWLTESTFDQVVVSNASRHLEVTKLGVLFLSSNESLYCINTAAISSLNSRA